MIVIGLGNPGMEYMETRHNVGFLFLDYLMSVYKEKEQHFSTYTSFKHKIGIEDVLFIKPQTYMNLSGRAVWELRQRRLVTPEEIMVVYDDTALPLGKIRIRKEGSPGGHNGIRSIINAFGGERKIPRLRIGVSENNMNTDLKDYVLSSFYTKKRKSLKNTETQQGGT